MSLSPSPSPAGLAELDRAARDLDDIGAHRYRDHAVRELRRLGRRHRRRPAPRTNGRSPRSERLSSVSIRSPSVFGPVRGPGTSVSAGVMATMKP
jgi:hypothetical protein